LFLLKPNYGVHKPIDAMICRKNEKNQPHCLIRVKQCESTQWYLIVTVKISTSLAIAADKSQDPGNPTK